jgi:nucleotide-binding universal stress UspA family protein
MMIGPNIEELRLALLRDAKHLVEREKHRLEGPHGTSIDANALEGSATDVLSEEAGPQDVIVVSSKSHSLLASVLLGSTAVSLAHRSRGPVVIVHPM